MYPNKDSKAKKLNKDNQKVIDKLEPVDNIKVDQVNSKLDEISEENSGPYYQENLNTPEDIRRVISKLEPVDSVDVDEIQSKLDEISEEKAAARGMRTLKLVMEEDNEHNKLQNVVNFEDIQSKIKSLPGKIFKNNEFNEDSQSSQDTDGKDGKKTNLSVFQKPGGVETANSNPYLKIDNVTAFID